ncbi:hypothetical protein RDWZM_000607 [Blomia tropicalis]|uniref:Uncharacterized protein n=1 Tax=Blomia tropicalis TaxID=40697 RepID=A0A9Q0MD45_BLOTA|nr:hypothetical protein RDWZM_000607 [Blomia tropicalis]
MSDSNIENVADEDEYDADDGSTGQWSHFFIGQLVIDGFVWFKCKTVWLTHSHIPYIYTDQFVANRACQVRTTMIIMPLIFVRYKNNDIGTHFNPQRHQMQ